MIMCDGLKVTRGTGDSKVLYQYFARGLSRIMKQL